MLKYLPPSQANHQRNLRSCPKIHRFNTRRHCLQSLVIRRCPTTWCNLYTVSKRKWDGQWIKERVVLLAVSMVLSHFHKQGNFRLKRAVRLSIVQPRQCNLRAPIKNMQAQSSCRKKKETACKTQLAPWKNVIHPSHRYPQRKEPVKITTHIIPLTKSRAWNSWVSPTVSLLSRITRTSWFLARNAVTDPKNFHLKKARPKRTMLRTFTE